MTSTKSIIAAGSSVLLGASLAVYWLRKKQSDLPTTWEEVGVVSKIFLYPMKSSKGISLTGVDVTNEGLHWEGMVDRSIMATTADDIAVTGREFGKLVLVKPDLSDGYLTLSMEGIPSIKVNLEGICNEKNISKIVLRTDTLMGYDCGNEVCKWLTHHVADGKTDLRLIYKGDINLNRPPRRFPFYQFPGVKPTDTSVYHDSAAVMIATEASLNALNKRLSKPVTFATFRPNIIVKNEVPFDEDDWIFIKIGDVILRRFKPCERCIFTDVDPNTGCQNPEVMDTLKKFRLLSNLPRSLAKAWARRPVFGSQYSVDGIGHVEVGAKVYISRLADNPKFGLVDL